jgi:hypothetical protein
MVFTEPEKGVKRGRSRNPIRWKGREGEIQYIGGGGSDGVGGKEGEGYGVGGIKGEGIGVGGLEGEGYGVGGMYSKDRE